MKIPQHFYLALETTRPRTAIALRPSDATWFARLRERAAGRPVAQVAAALVRRARPHPNDWLLLDALEAEAQASERTLSALVRMIVRDELAVRPAPVSEASP